MAQPFHRRSLLQMLGGAAIAAAGSRGAFARDVSRIPRLIGEARALDSVAARIAFISKSLLGTRYRANTLIGGPNRLKSSSCVTTPSIEPLGRFVAANRVQYVTLLRARRQHRPRAVPDTKRRYAAEALTFGCTSAV
jgi:hypothetical protein